MVVISELRALKYGIMVLYSRKYIMAKILCFTFPAFKYIAHVTNIYNPVTSIYQSNINNPVTIDKHKIENYICCNVSAARIILNNPCKTLYYCPFFIHSHRPLYVRAATCLHCYLAVLQQCTEIQCSKIPQHTCIPPLYLK